MHPRAVAKILASNKDLESYPCYKVVHADGSIGGYVAGTDEKIKRLQADQISVINNKIPRNFIIEKL